LSRLAASFVLGYHGCDAEVARKLVNREDELRSSDRKYDWLGPGAYFWESDPHRAMEWARQAKARGRIDSPAVIGAVVDLGNCLDLLNRENIELVRDAHALFIDEQKRSGLPIPENKSLAGEPDKILRFLDRAVIQFLHEILDAAGEAAFDSVRGLFPEGDELYPGAGFRDHNHIQIAVCNANLILGLFYPPDYPPG
jgi:hypothetical protein